MISIRLLSVLISFAMMLTGTYGLEAPQETARTLTLSNVTLAVNGESVTLTPSLSMGVSTDGAKALYDVAMNLSDKALFPVQVSVTEDAITALVKNADTAFTVPADAINSLVDAAMEQGMITVNSDEGFSEVAQVFTQEYIPAYTRLLKKATDPAFAREMNEKAQALLDQVLDRGTGADGEVEINGQTYEVTTYNYTLDSVQLMTLVDQVYALDEDMSALCQSLFKLYSKMPEESGLNGLTCFADLTEKLHMEMTADVTESIGKDAEVRVEDVELTMDMAGMVKAQIEASDAGEDVQAPELPPMVMVIHGETVGDDMVSTFTTEYEVENVVLKVSADSQRADDAGEMHMTMAMDAGDQGGMDFEMDAALDSEDRNVSMSFGLTDNGKTVDGGMVAQRQTDEESGETTFFMDLTVDAQEAANAAFTLSVDGARAADGTGHGEVGLNADYNGQTLSLSFDADVNGAPIEDVATGHDGLVIDDLKNMGEIMNDEANQGLLMQAAGSFMADAGTLTKDASVGQLMEFLANFSATTTDRTADADADAATLTPDEGAAPELGDEIEVEGDTDEYSYDDEPEDDGVLAYDMPAFGFLPEGWTGDDPEVDTAYDAVTLSFADDDYSNTLFATFYPAQQSGTTYVMDDQGQLVENTGRQVTVEQLEAGNWVATVTEDNVTANLYFYGQDIDLDAIAQIINGMSM